MKWVSIKKYRAEETIFSDKKYSSIMPSCVVLAIFYLYIVHLCIFDTTPLSLVLLC